MRIIYMLTQMQNESELPKIQVFTAYLQRIHQFKNFYYFCDCHCIFLKLCYINYVSIYSWK